MVDAGGAVEAEVVMDMVAVGTTIINVVEDEVGEVEVYINGHDKMTRLTKKVLLLMVLRG